MKEYLILFWNCDYVIEWRNTTPSVLPSVSPSIHSSIHPICLSVFTFGMYWDELKFRKYKRYLTILDKNSNFTSPSKVISFHTFCSHIWELRNKVIIGTKKKLEYENIFGFPPIKQISPLKLICVRNLVILNPTMA